MLSLYRCDHEEGLTEMASMDADWITGWSSGYEDSIVNPVVDNENYFYTVRVVMQANDSVEDIKFAEGKIDWQ